MLWLILALLAPPPIPGPPDPLGQPEAVIVSLTFCTGYGRTNTRFEGKWRACVTGVGYSAAAIGIQEGDHIIRINATEVNDPSDFYDAWSKLRPGAIVEIQVIRGLWPKTFTYTVQELKR